jgi:hypothetical protein
MKRLKRERSEYLQRAREAEARLARLDTAAIDARLAALEKTGLPAGQAPSNNVDKLGPGPDPLDQTKYPLGHLDAQYVEDRINWTAEKKLAERADADLQRQQENQQTEGQKAEQEKLAATVKSTSGNCRKQLSKLRQIPRSSMGHGSSTISRKTLPKPKSCSI